LEFFLINLLNGLSYGFLLFMLSAGLTIIFSLLGVLNFAHASFYMLGAYLGYSFSHIFGFWWGLMLAPLLTGLLGIMIERFALRRLHRQGQLAELLFSFGLAAVMLETVQLIWGKLALPYQIPLALQGNLFNVYSSPFSIYRGFIALLALLILGLLYVLFSRTRTGLIIQASLTQPKMVEALGHNVPKIFMWVFGLGCGLAGLAGAVGGNLMVTEPSMAAHVGSIIFVVIVLGGMGSLKGAFWGSMLIAIMQTFAVTVDLSLQEMLAYFGVLMPISDEAGLMTIRISQLAPVLPFLLLIMMLVWRPNGLFGERANAPLNAGARSKHA
jgi:branched-chain amino acid transport system permease protein